MIWHLRALCGWFVLHVLIPMTYVIGTLFRRPYLRMHGLRHVAERDLRKGRVARAEERAAELLVLARQFPDDFFYGEAVHHGHLLLGRIAMTRGDYDRAEAELLAAGKTPGSPSLDTFGPNCQLALELLEVGRTQPVLEYLQLCETFWDRECSQAAEWASRIRQGSVPDFGANLVY